MKTILYYIDKGILPGHLRVTCKCGWLLKTRPSLSNIECSNPDCPIHNSHKLAKALEILGIKAQIADHRALGLMLHFRLSHHMEVFNPALFTQPIDSSLSSAFVALENEMRRLDKTGIMLYQLIDAFCFDSIGETRSKHIFIESRTPEDFYNRFEDSEDGRVEMQKYIAKRVKVFFLSQTVVNITNTLIEYKSKILKVGKWFTFKNVYDETMYIAITGEVNKLKREDGTLFKPRETIAQYWSDKYGANIVTTGVTKKHVQYLIMDTNVPQHDKYSKATAFGITIVTSLEMDEILREKFEVRKMVEDNELGQDGEGYVDVSKEMELLTDELTIDERIEDIWVG